MRRGAFASILSQNLTGFPFTAYSPKNLLILKLALRATMDELQAKKLGIMLSLPPSHPNVETVLRLTEEALRMKVDVYLYLIDEGVKNLKNPAIVNLTNSGAKLNVCAYGCQQHKVSTEGYGQAVTFCGLVVLYQIITGCDRFLAFN